MEKSANISDLWENFNFGMDSEDVCTANDLNINNLSVETPTDTPAQSGTSDELTVIQNNVLEEYAIPTFYETIPTLQEMTAFVVSIALWRRVISLTSNPSPNADSYRSANFFKEGDETEVHKSLHQLPVPRLIRDIIEKRLKYVKDEMNEWLRFYKRNLFTSKRTTGEGTLSLCDLLFCRWSADGKIDDKKSALNMLSNPRLTEVDKFKIMCRYCLENEVNKLPAHSLPLYFTKRIQFSKNALMYYWLCHLNGDVNKLPKKSGESTECYLITAFNVDTWSAIEYFWDRLSVSEQLSKVRELLIRRPRFQKRLFSKMNDYQKFHLLSNIPIEIAVNFWRQKGQYQFTLTTWMYIRNFINYQQFENLFRALFNENSHDNNVKISCLVDIWNYAPDHLKDQALDSYITDIIMTLHMNDLWYDAPCNNIDLLVAYISYYDSAVRKKLLFDYIKHFVLRMKSSEIDKIFKLCFSNASDVDDMKKYVLELLNVQDGCSRMLDDNTLDHLNNFLQYFCADAKTRSEYCDSILDSFAVRGYSFYCFTKWIDTVEFIDNNLLDVLPDRALEYKKRLARSFATYICELWSTYDEMSKMIDVVKTVLDEQDIQTFKINALATVQTRYKWFKFDQDSINGFLLWCYDNDDECVRLFKKNLSIDGIFDYAWNSLQWNRVLEDEHIDQETVFKIFDPLSKALYWYFEDVDDVKRYKLKRVFGYCDKGYSMFRKYLNEENYNFTKNVIRWFFDGNQNEISKFKELYKDEDVSKMI